MIRPSNDEILQAISMHGNQRAAAASLGIGQSTLNGYLKKIRGTTSTTKITMPKPPLKTLTQEEVINRKEMIFNKKKNHDEATKRYVIKLETNDPIAVSFFGDPHIDDNGCNIPALRRDFDAVRKTDGMYGINMGDVSNNWVGFLSRLAKKQSVSNDETLHLLHWFMEQEKDDGQSLWLGHVVGNHDEWNEGEIILKSIMDKTECNIMQHQIDVCFQFPNGAEREFLVSHQFKGQSQWNPAHGVTKRAMMGRGRDVIVGGHIHQSAVHTVKNGAGRVNHCAIVGAYKFFDSFAKSHNFVDNFITSNYVAVFDPTKPRDIGTTMFASAQQGSTYLDFLRKKKPLTNKLIKKPNMKRNKGLTP